MSALAAARNAGFRRLSGDLIYALPEQAHDASLAMAGALLDLLDREGVLLEDEEDLRPALEEAGK